MTNLSVLARNWWAIALRGVLAIIFGILAFVWPAITLFVLVYIFGAYALLDGIFAIIAAVRAAERHTRWAALLIEGIISLAAGVIAFVMPIATLLAGAYLIAAWALLTGVLEIIAAVRLRRHMEGEWMLALTGVASIILGIVLAAFPLTGMLAFAWLVGAYAVIFGVLLLALGLRLRGHQDYTPLGRPTGTTVA